ncbi:2-iminobutanoate/2-iminopropanoate deaminase [Lishizhenia tianjinensis]|uniref:2-iminobutanoate/2-iminopropanoate deaminase n=1 Tax=Lishizhenia tianjinensis TaxID=477690 RepID=A0A1I6YER9_9FLAO|nr:RidA family protein [Lishizhenia tianjinensis]SFT48704.1 2-iminobutanoate/2-iminopropanoate deaminase [Lishizhenia tianjinensis]
MKKIYQIPGAPAPIGPYSQAVEVNNTLYISGQIPIDPKTGKLNDSSIATATQQVMNNIKALIETAGLDMSNIVKCSIFLKDMNNFAVVNEEYAQYFSSDAPARETVQVSKLPMDVDVEISCIAVRF